MTQPHPKHVGVSRGRVPHHAKHKGSGPALWLAAVVVALFVSSLLVIVLFLHSVLQLALEIAGEAVTG